MASVIAQTEFEPAGTGGPYRAEKVGMLSASTTGRAVPLSDKPSLATRQAAALSRLPSHTLGELLIPFSTALDLAEGRPWGHAQRVAYVAFALASVVGAGDEQLQAAGYGGLFHDVGVIVSSAGLSNWTLDDERLAFASLPLMSPEEVVLGTSSTAPDVVIEGIIGHAAHGGRLAEGLALPAEATRAIAGHHERWDGHGYPQALAGSRIPLVARIVGAADHIESLIAQEARPLMARRGLISMVNQITGTAIDPELGAAARSLAASDTFWLGLYGADLAATLRDQLVPVQEPRGQRILAFAERFSELVDSRLDFTVGIASQVARLAEMLGKSAGLPRDRLKLLRIAALLHDAGQLGVSERIMAKPAILTVEELDVLRQHPAHSRDVLAGVGGLEEVAEWVGAHHERPDGRGYPDGRVAGEIPLEALILAVADAYVAITSDRPHRRGVSPEDSVRILRGAAGTQLDGELVDLFVSHVLA